MRVSVSWRGCSCGCTPSDFREVSGEEKELIKACAMYYSNHRLYGTDPFRKVNVTVIEVDGVEVGQEYLKWFREQVTEEAEKIHVVDKQVHDLKDKIDKSFFAPFRCQEGYTLTEEQIKINEETKTKFEADKSQMKEALTQLRKFYEPYSKLYDDIFCQEEEEEEEEDD